MVRFFHQVGVVVCNACGMGRAVAAKVCGAAQKAAVVAVIVIGVGAGQVAQAADPSPVAISALKDVVDLPSLALAIMVLAGGALATSFALGGGFRVAHKAYRWFLGKIG